MGKSENVPLQVLTGLEREFSTVRTVFCPCLKDLPEELALTLGILPVHDANGRLLAELEHVDPDHAPDFAGLCLVDPFRRLDDILDRVAAAGINGVINLPTVVPFLEGQQSEAILALHQDERAALQKAEKRGFEVLFVTTPAGRTLHNDILLEDLRLDRIRAHSI